MSTVFRRGNAEEVALENLGADVGGAACRGGGCDRGA